MLYIQLTTRKSYQFAIIASLKKAREITCFQALVNEKSIFKLQQVLATLVKTEMSFSYFTTVLTVFCVLLQFML